MFFVMLYSLFSLYDWEDHSWDKPMDQVKHLLCITEEQKAK